MKAFILGIKRLFVPARFSDKAVMPAISSFQHKVSPRSETRVGPFPEIETATIETVSSAEVVNFETALFNAQNQASAINLFCGAEKEVL